MGQKQKVCGFGPAAFCKTAVIKSGNGGFSCTGGSNNQIAEAMLQFPFCLQCIQDGLLVRVGVDIKEIIGRPVGIGMTDSIDAVSQLFFLIVGKRRKVRGIPIGFKGGAHLLQNMGLILCGDFHIPFQPVCNGCMR